MIQRMTLVKAWYWWNGTTDAKGIWSYMEGREAKVLNGEGCDLDWFPSPIRPETLPLRTVKLKIAKTLTSLEDYLVKPLQVNPGGVCFYPYKQTLLGFALNHINKP